MWQIGLVVIALIVAIWFFWPGARDGYWVARDDFLKKAGLALMAMQIEGDKIIVAIKPIGGNLKTEIYRYDVEDTDADDGKSWLISPEKLSGEGTFLEDGMDMNIIKDSMLLTKGGKIYGAFTR